MISHSTCRRTCRKQQMEKLGLGILCIFTQHVQRMRYCIHRNGRIKTNKNNCGSRCGPSKPHAQVKPDAKTRPFPIQHKCQLGMDKGYINNRNNSNNDNTSINKQQQQQTTTTPTLTPAKQYSLGSLQTKTQNDTLTTLAPPPPPPTKTPPTSTVCIHIYTIYQNLMGGRAFVPTNFSV